MSQRQYNIGALKEKCGLGSKEGNMSVELEYWVWLSSLVKINAKQKKELIEYFGDPKNIWDATENELLNYPFATKIMLEQLKDNKSKTDVNNIMSVIQKEKISIIKYDDENYPENLKNIFDPPLIIYAKGCVLAKEKSIAVVGSRNATRYGLDVSKSFSYKLAKCGLTIISGLAKGIDSMAHIGALEAGGRTIAVLGCGVDLTYPKENEKLMENIILNGAVISEYVPGTLPLPFNFPNRNRLISGISEGVVVIEAGKKSGSLITANCALEQGREVFAIPGNINCNSSTGTNMLIKDGAKVVLDIFDILDELNISTDLSDSEVVEYKDGQITNIYIDASEAEMKIIKCIGYETMHIDMIGRLCNMDICKLNSLIVIMELKGFLEQLPGKIYRAKR